MLDESSLVTQLGLSEEEAHVCVRLVQHSNADSAGIEWDRISVPSASELVRHSALPEPSEAEALALSRKVAVLKLNGGLGTTMGCTGPKSVIEVRDGLNFLDINIAQINEFNKRHGSDVMLVLMNSFNTHEETMHLLDSKYKDCPVRIRCFDQSRFPRFALPDYAPVPTRADDALDCWYPPGHGDVYLSLRRSGLLRELREAGVEYVFISNVDNLGATLDLAILRFLLSEGKEFCMELTDKTNADVKGGTLIRYSSGGNGSSGDRSQLKLLEVAQVPAGKISEFKSVRKFKVFNTNNLWVSLAALDAKLSAGGGFLELDVIRNKKERQGLPVMQLEVAAGAAVALFDSVGVHVPRERFRPCKGTGDLFLLQSDAFALERGELTVNRARPYESVPIVKLGKECMKVGDYMKRIQHPVHVVELDTLTLVGNVFIQSGVTLRGTVIIAAQPGGKIEIASGAVLEDKVVTGHGVVGAGSSSDTVSVVDWV